MSRPPFIGASTEPPLEELVASLDRLAANGLITRLQSRKGGTKYLLELVLRL